MKDFFLQIVIVLYFFITVNLDKMQLSIILIVERQLEKSEDFFVFVF